MDQRCPRKLKSLPDSPCLEGRKAVDAERAGCAGGCPWFVADREANYCFFKFMADNGNRDVPVQKIAQKLLIDDSEVKKIVQRFRKTASEALNPSTDSDPTDSTA